MSGNGRPHVMAVCSQGGHLQEMLALDPAFRDMRVTYVTLPGADVDYCFAGRDVIVAFGPTERSLKNLARNVPFALKTVRRVRPDVMVSTGSGIAFPFFLAARLTGIHSIFIESLARRDTLSLTARLVYPLASEFYVQWPEAARGKAEYHGSVL